MQTCQNKVSSASHKLRRQASEAGFPKRSTGSRTNKVQPFFTQQDDKDTHIPAIRSLSRMNSTQSSAGAEHQSTLPSSQSCPTQPVLGYSAPVLTNTAAPARTQSDADLSAIIAARVSPVHESSIGAQTSDAAATAAARVRVSPVVEAALASLIDCTIGHRTWQDQTSPNSALELRGDAGVGSENMVDPASPSQTDHAPGGQAGRSKRSSAKASDGVAYMLPPATEHSIAPEPRTSSSGPEEGSGNQLSRTTTTSSSHLEEAQESKATTAAVAATRAAVVEVPVHAEMGGPGGTGHLNPIRGRSSALGPHRFIKALPYGDLEDESKLAPVTPVFGAFSPFAPITSDADEDHPERSQRGLALRQMSAGHAGLAGNAGDYDGGLLGDAGPLGLHKKRADSTLTPLKAKAEIVLPMSSETSPSRKAGPSWM